MSAPVTLRQLAGIAPTIGIEPAKTALVLIDIQMEYFEGGALPLPGGESAAANAASLLGWARKHGIHVVHVRHLAKSQASPFCPPGSPRAEFHPVVAPRHGEKVVTKHFPSSFCGTDLHEWLGTQGVDTLVIAGNMTHMCVGTTTRDALPLGYRVVLASDACATRDLPAADGDGVMTACEVQRATLAALADRFADVAEVSRIVEWGG